MLVWWYGTLDPASVFPFVRHPSGRPRRVAVHRTNGLFGAVLRLNRDPRYHNSLNAVVIAELVQELQHREPPTGPVR